MKVKCEVKAPTIVKLLVLLGGAFYVVMLSGGTHLVEDLWLSSSWFGLAAVLLSAAAYPIFMLIVFFTRTVFTDTGVIHTNFILRKTQKAYGEIENVEITRRSDIRLKFLDGTSIKVLTGQNYLSHTLQVLEKYVKLSPRQGPIA